MNISQQFTRLLLVVPKSFVAGAFTAVGSLAIAVALPWAWSHFRPHTELVGVFAQPNEIESRTQAAGLSCPSVGIVDVSTTPTHLETENWDEIVSGERLTAHVSSADGSGHEDVEGYDIRKNGALALDTISASYKGAVIGRGGYYLNRDYDGDDGSHRSREWWRGHQVSYDCHLHIAIRCPYVLGEKQYEEQMRKDTWLQKNCRPENEQEASRHGGQVTGG